MFQCLIKILMRLIAGVLLLYTWACSLYITCWFRVCSGVETKLHSRHDLIKYLSTLTWQTSTASSPLELYYWPSSSVRHRPITYSSIRNHSNKSNLHFYSFLIQSFNTTSKDHNYDTFMMFCGLWKLESLSVSFSKFLILFPTK